MRFDVLGRLGALLFMMMLFSGALVLAVSGCTEDEGVGDLCQASGLSADDFETFPCDPVCQTGCQDEQACYYYPALVEGQEPETQCGPSGEVVEGGACDEGTGCGPGLLCVGFECTRSCLVGAQAGEPGATCTGDRTCESIGGGPVGVCVISGCTLFPDDSCPENENCYVTESGTRECLTYNPGAVLYDLCEENTDCDAEQVCTIQRVEPDEEPGPKRCRQRCVPASGEFGCPEGLSCKPLIDPSNPQLLTGQWACYDADPSTPQ